MKSRGNMIYSPTLIDIPTSLKMTAKSLGIKIARTAVEAIEVKVRQIQEEQENAPPGG